MPRRGYFKPPAEPVVMILTLLLGMLPAAAFASGTQVLPQDADYKGFSMEDLNNNRWISYDKYSDQETLFFAPIYLSKGQGWTKLTFTIELSQYVSLELYKITDEHLAQLEPKVGNNKQIYHVLPLEYKAAKTENPTLDDLKEEFLGTRMGYLHGVSIRDQVKPREDEPKEVELEDALNIVPSGSNLEWDDILKKATAPDCPDKVTADNLYAFGFTGKKYIPPESDGEEETVFLAALEESHESSMDEAKIQNYFIWDGTVVGGEKNDDAPLDDGYYVIVLTSKEEPFWQYNSFLAFQQKADDIARFDAEHYHEPEMKAHEYARTVDPVDLFTGAFIWDYTDMSLFGKHDLPFTRYYNSIDADRNYGLGKGWSTEYTADLYLQPLFAQASLPNGRQLNFNINFDGSYQADGDYTLAWNGSGYTLTNTYTLDTYQFDADGNIQQLIHPNGNVIRYSYTGGRLASISNGSGTFSLEYNGDGNISKVTDSVGRSITMSYEGDHLTAVENPDGDSLRYTYDDNGYLTTVSNFKGQVYVQNTYNADGQVIHQYAAEIGTFDFAYDRDNRHNTCTGTDGYLLDIRYDDQGRIIESTDASGTTRFTWNDASQLTSQTDRDGNTISYTHDAAGNISQVAYPDGTVEKMEYNADRKVTKFTDRNGASSSYTYDGDGQVTSVTDSLGNTTVYGYTNGLLTSMTDALGNVTSYENDALGNRTSMTDALGNVTKYTYDSQGRLTTVTDAQGNKTAYEYTSAGKLVKITDPQGNVQSYTVDGNGFNTSESDWMGHVTAYERNTQNQVTKVTDPLGNATTYTYDERGNRVTSTDANGNTTSYGYDAAGRMISMTDAAGNTWKYTYDANGQMVSVTDPAGGKTTTAYGSTGRTSSTTSANGGATRYTYDGVGNTTKITDALGKTTVRTYDANGNLTSVTDRNGKTTTYAYDAENRMVSSTDALGRTTTYT